VRTHLEPVFDDDGDVVFLAGTSADISNEQTLRETRIYAATQMLEMENFVNLAAHDLRAPMRQITMLLEMLRNGFEDRKNGKVEIIKMLDDVSSNAKTLITDLLAHAQAADLDPKVGTFGVGDLVSGILIMHDPTGAHDVQVDNIHLSTDETALQIMLRNLIDNASRHSGDAFKKLAISAEASGSEAIKFSVRDYGTGFQGNVAILLEEGKMRKGAGFGLLMVRRLINARGGTITARSPEAGPGGLVKFTLPGKIKAMDSI
jgi:signal transduction histidine kinase